MKKLTAIAAVFLLIAILSGCVPCMWVKCSSGVYHSEFHVLSASDGRNVFFGPGKRYDKNLLKFYSLKGTDTTSFEHFFSGDNYPPADDSVMHVDFYPKHDTVYMRYSDGDVDTLKLTWSVGKGSTCCPGPGDYISNMSVNGSANLPINNYARIISK